MNANTPLRNSRERRLLILFAWVSILLISDLPDVIGNSFLGRVPARIFWTKVVILSFLFGLCTVWKGIRPLRQFAGVMLVFYLALAASTWTGNIPWWKNRFEGPQASFAVGYCGAYIRDSGVALAVIGVLWLMKRRRSEFFLVKGQLRAPVEPVRWLGIRPGGSWRTFGWIFAIAAGFGVVIPTALGLRLSFGVLLLAAPLLPAGLLFAAINAFNEEIYFRASLLSTLPCVIGKTHAQLINVVFFGLAHYLYGSPSGVIGFVMTGFLAWLLGKSMLETRGLAWAWFMHFVPDGIIFASYAILWVQK
jgi:hypothetical protein